MMKFETDVEAVDALANSYQKLKKEIAKVIVGQEDIVKTVLISLFCDGHSLLVGVPGLAKLYWSIQFLRHLTLDSNVYSLPLI